MESFANILLTVFVPIASIACAVAVTSNFKSRQVKFEQEIATYQQYLKFLEDYIQEKELDCHEGKVREHNQAMQFNYLLDAMESNQLDDGIAYLKQLIQDTPADRLNMTNNLAIGSVLNHRHEYMKENQIRLTSLIEVPECMHINDVDLCTVLDNLLGNAIEATKQVPVAERVVDLRIRYDGEKSGDGNLFIRIRNPHVNALEKGGLGGFLTSKRDQAKHGLGLYSVRRILEKYDGALDIKADEKEFVVLALIYGSSS